MPLFVTKTGEVKEMTRVALYVRVSTEEQAREGVSIDAQHPVRVLLGEPT